MRPHLDVLKSPVGWKVTLLKALCDEMGVGWGGVVAGKSASDRAINQALSSCQRPYCRAGEWK